MVGRKALATPTWAEQDDILRQKWNEGEPPHQIAIALERSIPAIMTRAARLGLPRRAAPGRKPRHMRQAYQEAVAKAPKPVVKVDPNSNRQLRVCLMCLSEFYSAGPHNRICPKCKESPEYVSASRLGEHSLSSY